MPLSRLCNVGLILIAEVDRDLLLRAIAEASVSTTRGETA
jgi:hypothetical protein